MSKPPEAFDDLEHERKVRAVCDAGKPRNEVANQYALLIDDNASLREQVRVLREQLTFFVAAKRFDRDIFMDDTAMVDWMLCRCWHMLAATEPK